MGIKKELTPNVIANSRREYRQFELAYNRTEVEKRQKSQDDRKSSFPRVKRVSRQTQKERIVDVYSTKNVFNTKSMPLLGFAAMSHSRRARSAHSTGKQTVRGKGQKSVKS